MKLKDLLAIIPAEHFLILNNKEDDRFFDGTVATVEKRLYNKEVLKLTHGECTEDLDVSIDAPDEIPFSQMEWDEEHEVYIMPMTAAKAV